MMRQSSWQDRPRSNAIPTTGGLTIDSLKNYLHGCGYVPGLLRPDFRFGADRTVGLAAFAHEPVDARSACIAAVMAAGDVHQQVISCRETGAPVVFVITPPGLQWWKQGETGAELVSEVPAAKAAAFIHSHKKELSPEAIYRAKTWGRFEHQHQLTFVDAGLMPLVEREIGQRLTSLIERVVHQLKDAVWPRKADVPTPLGQWLIKAPFWLLAAKILKDKQVPGFISVDLLQVEDVFRRLAQHYDSSKAGAIGVEIQTSRHKEALEEAAQEIAKFSHLGHVTTESLAYVYESALITRDTRASLGTHSTPPYLVDYLVWKLAPWIREIPVDERDVFEPACGHSAFLVSSMRLLKDLLPANRQADRRQYLRRHLHGLDVDSFALEIARLSLTLADIPNPNGWDLACDNMFIGTQVAKKANHATILLGNPPFEDFSAREQSTYKPQYLNKTAYVLGRVLPGLRPGGVFGFVVPQGLLHSKNAQSLRKLVAENFEIGEICLFPDKVFAFSDAESAVITGRRIAQPSAVHRISCRQVREPDMQRFRLDYAVTSQQSVPQEAVSQESDWSLRLPDLYEVWAALGIYPRLTSLVQMGQGLFYINEEKLRPTQVTVSKHRFAGALKGFAHFDSDVLLHGLPEPSG